MRFHALEGMDENTSSIELDFSVLCHEAAFYLAKRPECMQHRTPWILRVCAKSGRAILSCHEARGIPCELQVHNALEVYIRVNSVAIAVFRKIK